MMRSELKRMRDKAEAMGFTRQEILDQMSIEAGRTKTPSEKKYEFNQRTLLEYKTLLKLIGTEGMKSGY